MSNIEIKDCGISEAQVEKLTGIPASTLKEQRKAGKPLFNYAKRSGNVTYSSADVMETMLRRATETAQAIKSGQSTDDSLYVACAAQRHEMMACHVGNIRHEKGNEALKLAAAVVELWGFFYSRSRMDAVNRGREARHPGFRDFAGDFLRANKDYTDIVERLGGKKLYGSLTALFPVATETNITSGNTYWNC
jgi:hypothetical protein